MIYDLHLTVKVHDTFYPWLCKLVDFFVVGVIDLIAGRADLWIPYFARAASHLVGWADFHIAGTADLLVVPVNLCIPRFTGVMDLLADRANLWILGFTKVADLLAGRVDFHVTGVADLLIGQANLWIPYFAGVADLFAGLTDLHVAGGADVLASGANLWIPLFAKSRGSPCRLSRFPCCWSKGRPCRSRKILNSPFCWVADLVAGRVDFHLARVGNLFPSWANLWIFLFPPYC